jgi:hypothetical protein
VDCAGLTRCRAAVPVGRRPSEPCHDVLAWAAPVLAADLGNEASGRRWPGFAPEARRAGAAAVFTFPLMIGAIRAGATGMYRVVPGRLGPHFGDCLTLAVAATVLLLDSAGEGEGADGDGAGLDGDGTGLDGQAPHLALHRAEIDQATGMLTVQLGVTATEAFGGCGHALTRRTAARRDGRRHCRPAAAAAATRRAGQVMRSPAAPRRAPGEEQPPAPSEGG